MTTAKSSFKSDGRSRRTFRLYISSLKNSLGLLILFTCVTLLMFPVLTGSEMSRIMATDNLDEFFSQVGFMMGASRAYTATSSGYLVVYVVLAPVITICSLCRPLHSHTASDMYSSLPVSRRGMLGVWLAAGMTIMAVPLLIGYLCIPFLALIFGYPFFNFALMLLDFLLILLSLLSVTAIVLLCAVCTGATFDCVIFSGLIMAMPVLLQALISYIITKFAYGIVKLDFFQKGWEYLFPVSGLTKRLFWNGMIEYNLTEGAMMGLLSILFWTVIAAVLLGAAFYYIRIRKSEMSGSLNRNLAMEYIISAVVTLYGGLGIGISLTEILFLDLERDQWLCMTLFSAVGGALVYSVVQAILKRGFHGMKKRFAQAGAAFVALAAASGGLIFYIEVPLENYVPDFSELEYISFESNFGTYRNFSDMSITPVDWDDVPKANYGTQTIQDAVEFHSEESMQQFCELMNFLIEKNNRDSLHTDEEEEIKRCNLRFTYHLKNGRTVNRWYSVYHKSVFDQIVQQLCGQEEYIRESIAMFQPKYEHCLQEIAIWDSLMLRSMPYPGVDQQDSQQFRRLLLSLSEEFLAMDPMVYYYEMETPIAWVEYNYPRQQELYHSGDVINCSGKVPIYASFTRTVDLLEEYGYGRLLKPDVSEVEYAVITDSTRFISDDETLGRRYIWGERQNSPATVRIWVESNLSESKKEDIIIDQISHEELLEMLPRLRISVDNSSSWYKESRLNLIICTKDRYSVRYIEEQ